MANHLIKPLRFGTSGLRDSDENLTDREIYINTGGFIRYLLELGKERGGIERGDAIFLAADFRPSSRINRIPRTVAAAILDSGCTPWWCGEIPTPVVTYYGIRRNRASIMVTGSHIPYGMNGIKFNRPAGEILKEEEKPILSNVDSLRQQFPAEREALFDEAGWLKDMSLLPPEQKAILCKAEDALGKVDEVAKALYLKRYEESFGAVLEDLDLVFYEHTAVGRDILPRLFESLGAHIYTTGRMDEKSSFLPLDTEKMKPEIRDMLRSLPGEYECLSGRRPFAVISTDGDSDRPVLCDEMGSFIPGDKLGALASMFLKPEFIAIPVTCNSAATEMLQSFGTLKYTRVGSPYVVKEVLDAVSRNPGLKAAGYEANGGYLTGSEFAIGENILEALPTRDAALPLICALSLAKERNEPVSSLSALFRRHTNADVVDNRTGGCEDYTEAIGRRIVQSLSPGGILHIDLVRGMMTRPGEEEAAISEPGRKTIDSIVSKLREHFSPGLFTGITALNYLDGIRIYFESGDIVHLRPSGNAPEFRIYAEADSQQRADEIIARRVQILSPLIRDYR